MIWIYKLISNKIDHYKFWKDRVIETRLKTQRGHLTILGVYVPTECRDELNEEFYETLQKILDKVNKNYYITLVGDMNVRAGNNRVANVVGTNGETTLNSNGRKLIDFCTFNNLKIMNTFFNHKEIHKFTWEARGHKSVIDYFITNMKNAKVIQDIRTYKSNEVDSDHYLLRAKVNFPPRWLNKGNKSTPPKQEEFFKVRLFNDESTRWLYTQRVKLHLNNTMENEIGIEKEWENLQNIKISSK
ncbi:hypothetical protein Cfor_09350 [Coptotermes formosanus]|jgi:hypothetical protein|uniref:Endonuclease/exonuclease/phosphatase domain-containing protein n=1 Tax=Coptotermes formosanus TaxID=36987 RepID=A0A6L2Q3W3_COPFO|nr:hypothetical protein Cfor_09350 [Coptotermes formosanus]